jgi:hypothetical protein
MPEVTTSPGDQRDGCGPYGRHLTGAVNWQKSYKCYGGGTVASTLLVADRDYLIPIPPPSENISVDAIYLSVAVGGTASFIRASIYDYSNYSAPVLVVDAGELASDALAVLTFAHAAKTLDKNGRYAILLCGRGAVLPQLYTADPNAMTWLGAYPGIPTSSVSLVIYTRANGAFPAAYNGVYASVGYTRLQAALRLP